MKTAMLLLALLLPLSLSAAPGKEETQALTFAEKAFQDGIYDVAALNLAKFLKDYPNSELEAEARIYLAQCYLFQGLPKKSLELTVKPPDNTPDKLKPEFLFWQAEANYAMKDWAPAAARYRQLLKNFPTAPQAARARLSLSTALLQTEGETAALTALEPLLADPAPPADQQQALLQKARILISGGKLGEVSLIVDKMARGKVDRKAQYQLWYWIAELARMADKPAKAIENYQKITGDPRAFPADLIAKSWFGLGQVYKGQQKWPAAADAFQQAYGVSNDQDVMQAAVMEFLNAQLKNDTLTQGTIVIRKAAREHGAAGLSGLYAIGWFYYNAANYEAAITELDGLGSNNPNSEWNWPAQMLIAECWLKKNDPPAAVKILNKISAQDTDKPLALTAAYRLAEIQAQGGNADEALKNFLAIARQSASARQSENAYFQALMLMAGTGKTDGFAAAQAEFTGKFPNSPRLAEVAMEQARLLDAGGKGAESQKIYQTLSQNKDNPDLAAEALRRLAQLQYQAGAVDEALKNLLTLEQNFPKYANLANTVYLRVLIQKRKGALTPDEFRAELTRLIAAFPQNDALTVKAWFDIADSFSNQGNYAEAQANFQQVADKYPNSPLTDAARYFAGQCARRLGNYAEAIVILEKIPDAAPWKADARVAQIRCYIAQEKWQDAARIADSVIASRPQDAIWADASLRKVNCLYRFAKDDAKQYDAALTVLAQILAAKNITLAQRNEAGCLKGDILAQQQKPTEALAAYLDVVYGRLLPSDVTGLPAEPEQFWFNRAGVSAAQMLQDKGDIKGAIQVYRILERLSEPSRDEFRKRIDELKAHHFIYEES
ncbi:MAG: tetratricopeptide repeat protein [Verrucomicrobiales bacterium]|jgi:tetratricopeptide (TPR) repeat protein|nr:tetratricopeptide repeat protein [Verrucomicrobiales bacterium]